MKKLLISLILLQGCTISSPTDNNTAVEQLIEPPDLRTINSSSEASAQGKQMSSNLFQQKQWQLISYRSEQDMQAALAGKPATIQFVEQKISGSTGCNRYFASYQLIGDNTLVISQAGSTMMACPEKIAFQEQQFLKNLAEINFYQLQNDQLLLLDAKRQTRLIFQDVPPLTLEHTQWQVTGINNGKGGVVSRVNSGKAYMQFAAGQVWGSSGCNDFSAGYQVDASKLTIGPLSMTRKFCAENDLMTQEQELLKAIAKIQRYQIRHNQLRLLDTKGALMIGLKQQ